MSACSAAPPAPAGPLTVVTSELSPAVLVQTASPHLTLFGNLKLWGLGAPSRIALSTPSGVRTLRRRAGGEPLALPAGALMREPWVLAWFADASGWTQWDSPWLVVWQHRPKVVTLDDDGLHANASSALGTVALMPLYGLFKPHTQDWQTLPADAVRRCRFWTRVLRQYPVACDETFRLDAASKSVVVRDQFHWLATTDDWHTLPLKFAPLSPTLALAQRGKRMPMTVSAPVQDAGLVTAFGPYAGVVDADGYDVSFPVLPYVTQTDQDQTPDTSDPTTAAALKRLRDQMQGLFSSGDGLYHPDYGDPPHFADPPPQKSDNGNTCWALMSAPYPCRALPYLPADVRARAKIRLHRYFADWVLQPERFKPYEGKLLLTGPGIGDFGAYGDAGKFSSNTLIALWAYAHATDDWSLIKQRWPLIKKLFVTPRECSWRGYGRDGVAELGDEAAPALAMARLAWFVGDKDTFGYASYIFARELVHHVVKQTGATYFVDRQPLHNAEPMPANVHLTNLWGDMAGWQIDGPTYPAQTGERQYTNRWVRFGDPDVARFHRDHLQDLDRAELDGLRGAEPFKNKRNGGEDYAQTLPSMVRLRSLLLNETPATLDRITSVTAPTNSPGADAAYCLAFLHAGQPARLTTLFSLDETASAWAEGIARDRTSDEPVLDATVQAKSDGGKPGPPAVTWWGWKPPKQADGVPGGARWSFGQITVDRPLTSVSEAALSWNTHTFRFSP